MPVNCYVILEPSKPFTLTRAVFPPRVRKIALDEAKCEISAMISNRGQRGVVHVEARFIDRSSRLASLGAKATGINTVSLCPKTIFRRGSRRLVDGFAASSVQVEFSLNLPFC